MKILKSKFHVYFTALLLGIFSIGFTSTATAASTYDATAGLTLTLTGVTDAAGTPVNDGWSVFAEYQWPSTSLGSTGDGVANASATTNIDEMSGILFLGISDSVTLLSTSDGITTNGTATSSATNPLYMSIYGSEIPLNVSFDYIITSTAVVTGDDANASASVWLWDTIIGSVDVLAEASASTTNALTDDESTSGSFTVMLGYGGFTQFIGHANTSGSAASVIPIPAAFWLFGSGLIGLIGLARRKKA